MLTFSSPFPSVKTSWFALYSSGNARQIDTPKPTTASPTTSILSRDSVLGNHDLLEFIFSFLQVDYNIEELEYEDPEMKVKRGTLLKAALTCRGFRQPGLQVLWRVIDTFDPLLSLLPDYDNDRVIRFSLICFFPMRILIYRLEYCRGDSTRGIPAI